ncbi:MAG: response regulator [Xanthobacteraceae bacterium]|nr:response regulator [Xanthobacteraceae bacterium]
MTDDFVSLKAMIVSEAAADRELIRRGAAGASLPVIISEVVTTGGESAALRNLASETFDVVLFDDGLASSDKEVLLAAVRGEASRPLAVVIGEAAGLDVDGALAKPLAQQHVAELIGECIATRLPKRVLIVDDSAAVRQVIQKVLKASHFPIAAEEADGHAAACSHVTQQAYDVVILDCHMAGKDGFDTLEALLQIRPDAKILMTTERQDHTFADRARREGAAEFLYKPFFARDIDAAFSRLLRFAHLRWS